MVNERVVWGREGAGKLAPCLVCGNMAGNRPVLRAMHWRAERGMMQLAECGVCRSCYYPDALELNCEYPGPEEALRDPNFPLLVHHYLEIVAGLDWKVWLLEQLPFKRFQSVLEIGCNAGVALDYCRTLWGAEVIGLEPSAYGILGGKLLDVPVVPKYMQDAREIAGRSFDFVFATEVLEHVPEPLAFLHEVRAHLEPDGMLLITTPRAAAISTTTPVGELYAALSPGAHYFMLSPAALRSLLERAGFAFVEISEFGMTNVAVASNDPIMRKSPPLVHERIKA